MAIVCGSRDRTERRDRFGRGPGLRRNDEGKDAFGEECEGAEGKDERGSSEFGFRGREEPEGSGGDGENEV